MNDGLFKNLIESKFKNGKTKISFVILYFYRKILISFDLTLAR